MIVLKSIEFIKVVQMAILENFGEASPPEGTVSPLRPIADMVGEIAIPKTTLELCKEQLDHWDGKVAKYEKKLWEAEERVEYWAGRLAGEEKLMRELGLDPDQFI